MSEAPEPLGQRGSLEGRSSRWRLAGDVRKKVNGSILRGGVSRRLADVWIVFAVSGDEERCLCDELEMSVRGNTSDIW